MRYRHLRTCKMRKTLKQTMRKDFQTCLRHDMGVKSSWNFSWSVQVSSSLHPKDHLETIITFVKRNFWNLFLLLVFRVVHVESSSDMAPRRAKMCLEISASNLVLACHCFKNFQPIESFERVFLKTNINLWEAREMIDKDREHLRTLLVASTAQRLKVKDASRAVT